MKRLRHTGPEAYLRFMQISTASLFVFVEGKRGDRSFYSTLAAFTCSATNIIFDVITAAELPEAAGGKDALITFYNFLLNRDALRSDWQGKKTAGLFFADKDIDDLLGLTIRSPHFVYTRTYDLEGTLFEVTAVQIS
jgi:hypothetical protein